MNRAIRAVGLLALLTGCSEGTPASPAFESTPGTDGGTASFAVCPPGMDASFGSIYTQMLSTSSCGTNNPTNCHSTTGSSFSNLLDMSLDAGAVYAELLGDGGGHKSTNAAGDAAVLRVVPFDADASMLYIKLTLKSPNDPSYGSGMPLGTPGSVCPDTVAAVRDWINAGATFAGSAPLDAAVDAVDADAGIGSDATVD